MSTTSGRRSSPSSAPYRERVTRRLLDVLVRDFGKLVALNLLLCLAVVPPAALYASLLAGAAAAWVVVPALVASAPFGGAVGASMFCITQLLQRQPLWIWFDFRRKFVENWRALAVPGAVLLAFSFAQLRLWAVIFTGVDVGIWGAVVLLLSFCAVLMVAPYLFLQEVYLDAGVGRLLANALVLASSNVRRTFAGMFCANAPWAVAGLLLPTSLVLAPVVLLIGLSLTVLANLVFIWPVVDGQFGISEELSARRARVVQDVIPLRFLTD